MEISQNDIQILRELGKEYMEVASLPVQREKMTLWKNFNACGSNMRPMIIIDQLPWNELNDTGELTLKVEHPFFREIEWNLRTTLYKWRHLPADMVVEPLITIPKAIHNSGYGLNVEKQVLGEKDTTAFSQHFIDVLKSEEDVEKIKDMVITVDEEETRDRFKTALMIWDGIAPVVLGHGIGFHLGVWDRLSEYMGVENIYLDLYDRPEFLHACMRRITDATIAGIKQANELKIHDDIVNTCHCSYIYTDELLPDFGKGGGTTSDKCWAFGLAQLFSYTAPAVTEEFEIPYIQEMAKYFHSIYYGCCDRLDDRMDLVFKIPNVRKISCSPWSKKEPFAEQLQGKKIIMSNKPNPAFLAAGFDEDMIRRDLRETMDIAKKYGVAVELIQKDISTVNHSPKRLTRWAEIAMEEAMR
ncbi:MAG: hypothetical protein MRZ59_04640 [Clostridiales bacterium]|nr:hypothetical protein [Clostridiales bacterium]MDY3748059.1 hypothetical protein [Lachnospiraceae bacterium]